MKLIITFSTWLSRDTDGCDAIICHKMLEHHIQKSIVYKLAFSSGMRFSELQPADLDNKLFDYHLKQVIRDGLVEKGEDGLYRLTSEGRRIGVGAVDKHFAELDRAHSVLFLIIRRTSDNAVGYSLNGKLIHCSAKLVLCTLTQPRTTISSQLPADELRAKTGLSRHFHIHRQRIFYGLRRR